MRGDVGGSARPRPSGGAGRAALAAGAVVGAVGLGAARAGGPGARLGELMANKNQLTSARDQQADSQTEGPPRSRPLSAALKTRQPGKGMDTNALCEMFPSLTRAEVEGVRRQHRNEDATVTALMELQERRGGVAQGGAPPEPARGARAPSPSPSALRKTPVAMPSAGNVPFYWGDFWRQHAHELSRRWGDCLGR